ncbi:hypothetical protein Cst_c07400 [Thermoclostridium stercorarium subsp. stercorarium DSM 8532]|uniref:Uncharacterized protein n=1 Tax=Thermoclostridium stercorarium (strain ATCC 35414 / DSM 8532 / NCIMB 11754) TaxID=1121335 RepID=L7VI76_THES1|nr:hypothetical protein Cst_c07400 [Thermoclostridium stercorarium subsp. stercorarium DSM 8532]
MKIICYDLLGNLEPNKIFKPFRQKCQINLHVYGCRVDKYAEKVKKIKGNFFYFF